MNTNLIFSETQQKILHSGKYPKSIGLSVRRLIKGPNVDLWQRVKMKGKKTPYRRLWTTNRRFKDVYFTMWTFNYDKTINYKILLKVVLESSKTSAKPDSLRL